MGNASYQIVSIIVWSLVLTLTLIKNFIEEEKKHRRSYYQTKSATLCNWVAVIHHVETLLRHECLSLIEGLLCFWKTKRVNFVQGRTIIALTTLSYLCQA